VNDNGGARNVRVREHSRKQHNHHNVFNSACSLESAA
jgi:hypothetical protein